MFNASCPLLYEHPLCTPIYNKQIKYKKGCKVEYLCKFIIVAIKSKQLKIINKMKF